jgi:hypothetical protein
VPSRTWISKVDNLDLGRGTEIWGEAGSTELPLKRVFLLLGTVAHIHNPRTLESEA